MYTNSITDLEITFIIVCIDQRVLKRRATLKTLNVLNTLKVLSADKLDFSPSLPDIKLSSTMLRITTKRSRQFIVSFKYLIGPKAMSLNPSSPINMKVNTSFMALVTLLSPSGILYLSIPRTIVFNNTQNIIRLSKKLDFTNFLITSLLLLYTP